MRHSCTALAVLSFAARFFCCYCSSRISIGHAGLILNGVQFSGDFGRIRSTRNSCNLFPPIRRTLIRFHVESLMRITVGDQFPFSAPRPATARLPCGMRIAIRSTLLIILVTSSCMQFPLRGAVSRTAFAVLHNGKVIPLISRCRANTRVYIYGALSPSTIKYFDGQRYSDAFIRLCSLWILQIQLLLCVHLLDRPQTL